MSWYEKIYRYCERAGDPGFWAEPFNALTNVAFIIAALAGFAAWTRRPRDQRGLVELCLVLLVLIIGVGSFIFHTYATRWASLADTGPIGVFMLAYLAYALRRYARAGWIAVAAGLVVFAWTLQLAGSLRCDTAALLPVTAAAYSGCLNGTAGYVPAFGAMLALGIHLRLTGHPASAHLLAASALFAVSMAFRTLDLELCDATRRLAGRPLGTHFIWHVLNATLLYVLLRASIRHGQNRAS